MVQSVSKKTNTSTKPSLWGIGCSSPTALAKKALSRSSLLNNHGTDGKKMSVQETLKIALRWRLST